MLQVKCSPKITFVYWVAAYCGVCIVDYISFSYVIEMIYGSNTTIIKVAFKIFFPLNNLKVIYDKLIDDFTITYDIELMNYNSLIFGIKLYRDVTHFLYPCFCSDFIGVSFIISLFACVILIIEK